MGEQDSKDKVLIVEKRLIMNSVGEIIATNRKRLGWSQTELAERLQGEGFNLTNKAISKWEKNDTEPSVTIFLTLCRIMGVTDIYEAYFGSNPDSLVNGLNTAGREKVLDYIELLHDSGKYKSSNPTAHCGVKSGQLICCVIHNSGETFFKGIVFSFLFL